MALGLLPFISHPWLTAIWMGLFVPDMLSGCDWLGPIYRRLAQSGLLVFTSRLVGKGYTTINLVPTPQVKWVSSSQRSPVEFTEDCCSTLQMCSLGCFSKDLSILSLVTCTPKGDS
jgi:hypothetical protein